MTPRKPYRLVILWVHGAHSVQAEGHNPVAVRAAESQVARNPRVIDRIEFHDLIGRLETIWSREWN